MTRTESIIKAIKDNNITPDIEEKMKEDIKKAELKRIKELFSK
jgi:hypothetical protein